MYEKQDPWKAKYFTFNSLVKKNLFVLYLEGSYAMDIIFQ